MANTADLRGLIRDSNRSAEIVDAVEQVYRDGTLDYQGCVEVLLNDGSINEQQNVQWTRERNPRPKPTGGEAGRRLTLPEQREDWKQIREEILAENPNARIDSNTDAEYVPPEERPVATRPARTGGIPSGVSLQAGEWIYPDGGTPYKECLCGCGGHITSKKARFKPGHDAKLKSRARKTLGVPNGVPAEGHLEFTDDQWRWLATQGWEPPEGVI